MELIFETKDNKMKFPINPELEPKKEWHRECIGECFMNTLLPLIVEVGCNEYQIYMSEKEFDRMVRDSKKLNE